MLRIENLSKSYPTGEGVLHVLSDISLSLEGGQTLALTGESGSGKSTLLHLIGGLDRADTGSIMLNGVEMAGLSDRALARLRRETIGLVFQQFNLIPSLDIARNLSFQARLAGRLDAAWLDHLASALGIGDLMTRYPEQLSGGQQQRVAIGRALAGRPALILADEPTGNLDEENGDAVLALLLSLVRDSGAGLLMVTHSDRLAARLDRRAHLAHGRLGDRAAR